MLQWCLLNPIIGKRKTHDHHHYLSDCRSYPVFYRQYLQPTAKHLLIHEFITPEKFEEYRQFALKLGFKHVESSPLVRSSYHAEKHIH